MSIATKKLTEVQKAFVVRRLAAYDSPQEAADALRDRFGVEITPQAVEYYHPWKWAGRRLAKKWTDLFEVTRANFDRDLEAHVPIANLTFRMRALTKQLERFEREGNGVGALRVLEQAAKEMGGCYTNQRQYTGKSGGPIQYADVSRMTMEQLEAELRSIGVDPETIGRPVPASSK